MNIERHPEPGILSGGDRITSTHRMIVLTMMIERGMPLTYKGVASVFEVSHRHAFRMLRVAKHFAAMDGDQLIDAAGPATSGRAPGKPKRDRERSVQHATP